MKTSIISIILLAVMPICFGGEALGVKYDDLYLVRLKAGNKKVNHKDLLLVGGKQPQCALEVFRVSPRWMKRVDKLFPKDGNYDHGLSDSRLQLYSLVFYAKGKVVLSITPNLLGSDLYASNFKGYQSMSGKQREEFLNLVFIIMGRCEKAVLP